MDQHLDPERLAAFMDGSLPRAERLAAEAHAADCDRCLQLLAAMARTEPVSASRGWRFPVLVRWAVPLAAAAAAIALWVNVDRAARESQQLARSGTAVADAVSPAPVPVSPPAAPSAPVSPSTARLDSQPSAPGSTAKDAMRPATPTLAAPSQDRQGPVPRDAARADALRNEAVLPKAEERAPVAAASPAPSIHTSNRLAQRPSARQAAPVVEIVSPDPSSRWRAVGTAVQRSTDGAKTWTTQAVSVQAELLAGSSPSPGVAWLVGRSGYVLLTIDGQEWRRVEFPDAIDLVGVRAQSALEADVTTSDGRVFRTADGGRTWLLAGR